MDLGSTIARISAFVQLGDRHLIQVH